MEQKEIKGRTMDRIDKIIAYESGELSGEETIKLFQELIDGGMAWSLQGSYGRTARALIEAGLCHKTGWAQLDNTPNLAVK